MGYLSGFYIVSCRDLTTILNTMDIITLDIATYQFPSFVELMSCTLDIIFFQVTSYSLGFMTDQ